MSIEKEQLDFIQKQFLVLMAFLTLSLALNFWSLHIIKVAAQRPIAIVIDPSKSQGF